MSEGIFLAASKCKRGIS